VRKGKKGRKVKTGELVIFDDYFDIKLKIAKSFKKMLNDKKKG
jgi:nucleoid DNA-binding protein